MKKLSFTLIFLAILVLLFLAKGSIGGSDSGQALSQASKMLKISSSSAREIETQLKIAEKEADFRPWSSWMRGVLAERSGKMQDALKYFSEVNASSASYPDALLSTVLLSMQLSQPNQNLTAALKEKFSLAEVILDKTRRTDLLPRLHLAKALLFKHLGDLPSAVTALIDFRKSHYRRPESKQAREALYSLIQEKNYKLSLPEQLEDVSLLIKEKELVIAEEKLKEIQSQVADNSPAKLDTLLVEEKLLRAQGKNSQADELLRIASADGKTGTGDVALKNIISLDWNDNKQDLALDNINRFISRFPDSPHLAEINYIHGRIFEEQDKNNAAKLAFEQALRSNNPVDLEIKILRQLAWAHYRDQEFSKAASYFEKIQSALEKDSSDYDQELLHARYWKEAALKKAVTLGETDKSNLESLKELRGYYAILAAKEFAQPLFFSGLKNNSPELSACGAENTNQSIYLKLDKFNSPYLLPFLRAEAAWWSTISDIPLTPEEEVRNSVLKLSIFSHYNLYRDMIEQAAKTNHAINKSKVKLASNCELSLLASSHPLAYIEHFKQSAEPALALAIARTESGFDSEAISSKNAFGIMQIIQETAKKEGLKENESLFDLQTNIKLGTKHIENLLQYYNGDKVFAIAAYNAGSVAVDRWKNRYPRLNSAEWIEHIAYPETKSYVKRVLFAEAVYKEILN